MARLLIVEDDPVIGGNICDYLQGRGHACDWAPDGFVAMALAAREPPEAVVLDLNLPRLDGLTWCRRFREELASKAPVIMLTARDELDDKLAGFDAGADDYLVKPIEVRELVALMHALLRRQAPGKRNELACADLHYDLRTRQFQLAGAELLLPPRERTLLETLMRHAGEAVSRQALVESLFGLDEDASADAIDLYIHRLRKKLEASGATILTLRGIGWMLRERKA